MPLIYNGTTIDQTSGTLKFGTTEVEKVIFNGVTVWEKIREKEITDITGTFPNWYFYYNLYYAISTRILDSENPNVTFNGYVVDTSYGGIGLNCHSQGEEMYYRFTTGFFDRTGYNKLQFKFAHNTWSPSRWSKCFICNTESSSSSSYDITDNSLFGNRQELASIDPFTSIDDYWRNLRTVDININDYFTDSNITIFCGHWDLGSSGGYWMDTYLYDFKLYN